MKQNPPRRLQVIDGPLPQEECSAPVRRIIAAVSRPATAARVTFQFCGMTVQKAFARRPRVLREMVSKPRSGGREPEL